ncbi:MAG: T9SS type A sorting domain-containing protein [Prevotellaceae bacterium]|jgi:hypothetical protein|nr:T9SS type A sorting domain-containing protein [Prevotellaceae bacterium]
MKKIFKAARNSTAGLALMAAVSTANAVPTYVDIGVNCVEAIPTYIQNTGTIAADTVLKYCAGSTSGMILNPLNTLLVYPGTSKELSIIPSEGITLGNDRIRDLYIGTSGTNTPADLPTRHWKLMLDTTAPENTYIEVRRTGTSGDITSVTVNGVSNSADVGANANVAVLFSDNAIFDSASVIGYSQVLLPPIRRGLPAQTVAAPAGAKSFRLYNTVTLQAVGGKYAIVPHRTGDTVLTAGAGRTEIRFAYIGVEMDVPLVAMGSYVDIGLNVDTTVKQSDDNLWPLTRVDTAYSGKVLPGAAADTVYRGTDKEVVFSVAPWYGSNVAVNDRGCYWPNNSAYPTMRYWQINTANGRARYIEVNPNVSFGEISKIALNGTSGSTSVKTFPIVAFSDKLPFDSTSLIGIVQDTFPVLRAGGEVEISPTVPAGSKSFRIYHQLIYTSVGGGKWAESPTGTDTLKTPQAVRVAYIGVMRGQGAVPKVSVSPASLTMQTGTTQQLAACVKALGTASPSVTWSVTGAVSNQTSISADGLLTVATGDLETATSIKVVATSDFDITVADTAYITLSSVVPEVNGVSVKPATVTKLQGDTASFTATVDAVGGASTSVKWSVDGAEGTSIDADGLLTISPNEPATSLTVTATSSFDATKTGTATVTVAPLPPAALSVTVSPAAARVMQGDSVQLTVETETQGGAVATVTWSVVGSSAATTVNEGGLLVVGVTETASSFSVIATSDFDPTVADTATVMVDLPVSDDYVDWGVDLISDDHSIYGCGDKKAANTMLAYAKSGRRIRETPPGDTIYAGSEKEMIVKVEGVGSGLIYQSGSGQEAARFYIKRGATPNHPDNPDFPGEDMSSAHWRLVDGSGFFSMEVANASAERTIDSVTINGTSNNSSHIDGTDHCTLTGTPPVRVTATILFSDVAPFDENSVLGYDSVSLAASRSGGLAQTIAAPKGTKSYRVYHTVTLGEYGEKYRINPSGNIQLVASQEIRLGYLGATLSSLTGGTILSVSVDPAAPTVMKGIPQGFTATVTKEGPAATTVTWSVSGNTSASTVISQTSGVEGVLTVATDETATTLTVTATSTVDPTVTGTATVTVAGSGGTAVDGSSYLPLQIYPNPVTDGWLTVSAEELKVGDKIRIYTLTGWLAAVYNVDYPATSVNVSQLPAGVYVVKAGKYVAKLVISGK